MIFSVFVYTALVGLEGFEVKTRALGRIIAGKQKKDLALIEDKMVSNCILLIFINQTIPPVIFITCFVFI